MGYLGALIDTTNVPGILQIDVLATDWFHTPAYPTYLYYNSYDIPMAVDLPLPPGTYDIYELASNQMVATSVSDTAVLNIMEDAAWLVAIVPAGGVQSYDYEKLLIDGIVVDYLTDAVVNHPPRIKGFGTPTPLIEASTLVNFFCAAEDREDGTDIAISWYLNETLLAATGSSIQFMAPGDTGSYEISCQVMDSDGLSASDSTSLHLVENINHAPVIQTLSANRSYVLPNTTTTLSCTATDEDNDDLSFSWSAPDGGTLSGSGNEVSWLSTDVPGEYTVSCVVTDPSLAADTATVQIVVTDSTSGALGFPVLSLPFSGTLDDVSGYGHSVTFSGASYVADRAGHPNAALHFDGENDRVQVSNATDLNFTEAISVSLWLNVEEFFGRESYPISHGNWENRWKISITENRIRWTVKTSAGIRDLDSVTELELNTYYHVVTLYDGYNFDIYINGVLDQHTTFSGSINQTSIDLTIGQVLPGNSQYNFKGIIDDVRLYNYGLTPTEIYALYAVPVNVIESPTRNMPEHFSLRPAYPNPFNPSTTIDYALPHDSQVTLTIHDIAGKEIALLTSNYQEAGQYSVQWNGLNRDNTPVSSGLYICRLQAGNFTQSIKIICLR